MLCKWGQVQRHKLCNHHEINIDLLLTHQQHTKGIPITYEWVKGHANTKLWDIITDLCQQKLSCDEIYNIWCDRMAGQKWVDGSTPSFQPDFTLAEKWAVYAIHPQYHKLVGNSSGSTATYICIKHGLSESKLNHVNTYALQCFLSKLKIFKQANIVKLIYGWIPTLASL